MTQTKPYRHENKYIITLSEYYALRSRLSVIASRDKHVDESGKYRVTSLYFDNCFDKALREKADGAPLREKFRLRRYNDDIDCIFLEKKQKVNALCLKTQCGISREMCEKLLRGEPWCAGAADLARELDYKMQTQLLRPKTLVVYTREPYVFPAGNVRITFDTDVKTGLASTDFFSNRAVTVPASLPGRIILEVKYDAFLPDVICDILQTGLVRAGAFSKYAACRDY